MGGDGEPGSLAFSLSEIDWKTAASEASGTTCANGHPTYHARFGLQIWCKNTKRSPGLGQRTSPCSLRRLTLYTLEPQNTTAWRECGWNLSSSRPGAGILAAPSCFPNTLKQTAPPSRSSLPARTYSFAMNDAAKNHAQLRLWHHPSAARNLAIHLNIRTLWCQLTAPRAKRAKLVNL